VICELSPTDDTSPDADIVGKKDYAKLVICPHTAQRSNLGPLREGRIAIVATSRMAEVRAPGTPVVPSLQ